MGSEPAKQDLPDAHTGRVAQVFERDTGVPTLKNGRANRLEPMRNQLSRQAQASYGNSTPLTGETGPSLFANRNGQPVQAHAHQHLCGQPQRSYVGCLQALPMPLRSRLELMIGHSDVAIPNRAGHDIRLLRHI